MGTWYTEVRLDGLCEGGLGQQKVDGGGSMTMRKRYEGVVSHGAYVGDCVSCGNFLLVPVFCRTVLPRSGGLSA